jgi:hypothetical protein
MSKQEIKVYALPTNKATKGTILENIGVDKTFIISTELEANAFNCVKPTSLWQAIHLYATTDETPKADEYGYSISTNTVELISELQSRVLRAENWRKVVATDDKSLLKNDCDCGATTYEGCSQCLTGIGKLSPEFQAAWVREMNIGTPIVEALMEMEEFYSFGIDDILTVNKNVYGFSKGSKITVTEVKGDIIYFKEDNVHKKGFHVSHLEHSTSLQPKLNPQGYVTIFPVGNKKLTPEEQEAIKRFQNGEQWNVSTFIDEDSIIAGYGNLNMDFQFPLPVVYIKAIYGTTSWSKHHEETKRKAELCFSMKEMYTKEEVKQLLWKCYVRDYAPMSPDDISDKIIPKFNKYIEQNL